MESNDKDTIWALSRKWVLVWEKDSQMLSSLLAPQRGWLWLDAGKEPIPEDLRGMSLKNQMLLYLLIANILHTKR